jgi:2,4-dienoyl-CoA reductase-like NADH-dependent reductase (Old Yellow Enzyme family)/pyruvate/2-oxoglutarate dehydrogenase complex dihydrolipoamide dehydrogenase (E3) component
MNKMFPRLFERGKIGGVELENRIIKAATRLALQNPDGTLNDRMTRFYEETARGGVSLVIVNQPAANIPGPDYTPELTFLAKVIYDNGAKSCLQLTTARRGSPQDFTIDDLQKLASGVGDVALRAQTAGYDMVEIHTGHGGLMSSFLSPAFNKRNDQYGGSVQNRMRFVVEVVQGVRKKVKPGFPVMVRLSAIDYLPSGLTLEDSLEIARVLEQNGVDAFDVDGGHHATPHAAIYLAPPMILPEAFHLPSAAAIKKVVHVPVMVAGAVTTPELAEKILESGKVDFIGIARALFADPYWPKKAKEGRPEDIVPCIRCNVGCHDLGPPTYSIRCATNPALAWEDRLPITSEEHPKSVAIIGGGPGGMEAARVCALRGHKVTIYEKRKLGGVLIEASVPDFKADIRRLTSYYLAQVKKLKIKVVHQEAKVETIRSGKFDAVVVAVGAAMRKPDVAGIDKPNVTDVISVLNGKAKVGQRVHVVGGGIIAVEVGLWLAEQGKQVTFTTRQNELMRDVGQPRAAYEERLAKQKKVTVHTGKALDKVTDKGTVVVDSNGNRLKIVADTVVLASGFLPQLDIRDQFEKETNLDVYAVGDCVSPRLIYDAIHDGFAVGRKI